MSFFNFFKSFFKNESESYQIEKTKYGIIFTSPRHQDCIRGLSSELIQYQYILLQMLLESSDNDNDIIPKDLSGN